MSLSVKKHLYQKLSNLRRLEKLDRLFSEAKTMLIVLQDYPDPDAIAAASAFRLLAKALGGVSCTLSHGGGIGRAENRALVQYLALNLRHFNQLDPKRFDLIALLDTQPGTGNNALPATVVPQIVIDHHPIQRQTRRAGYTDIRSHYGSTSTILFEYLQLAGIEPDVPLATGLLYGIRSDTQDLGREATKADIDAYLKLYPKANKRILSRIEHATVPRHYFQVFSIALQNARVYGTAVICFLPSVDPPDALGELADLLLRWDQASWVLCYGIHGNQLLFSLRSSDINAEAGTIMKRTVATEGTGGGHNTFAGGQIPLDTVDTQEKLDSLKACVEERFLRSIRQSNATAEPLLGNATPADIDPE
jgi:nanoRNase/pAp phosphatase (c-di-AMP/oligoRNAs hydrolase)